MLRGVCDDAHGPHAHAFQQARDVAERNLANGEHILRGLNAEQIAGTATGLDVAQQETTVALLYAAIPPLKEQFRQTVYALAVLIGAAADGIAHGSANVFTEPDVEVSKP